MRFQEIEQLMNRVGLLLFLAHVGFRRPVGIDVRVVYGRCRVELFTAEFLLCQAHDYFLFQAFRIALVSQCEDEAVPFSRLKL